MVFVYVFLIIWILFGLWFLIYVISLKRNSIKLSAEIVEKVYFDNIFGQRFSWIISFIDKKEVRRLFNTIYKSNKTAPEVGKKVDILKVNVFKKTKYITNLQINSLIILPILMVIIPSILLVDLIIVF